jgi:hypothetical protein
MSRSQMDAINIMDDPSMQFHNEVLDSEKWKATDSSKHADRPSEMQYVLTDVTRLLWSHNDF